MLIQQIVESIHLRCEIPKFGHCHFTTSIKVKLNGYENDVLGLLIPEKRDDIPQDLQGIAGTQKLTIPVDERHLTIALADIKIDAPPSRLQSLFQRQLVIVQK